MKKIKMAYLLLGIGIGIILANGLYYLYPEVKYKDLSDEIIIEKAKELGYISLKESIIREKETRKKVEPKEIKKAEESEEEKSFEILIQKGDHLSDIAKKLFDAELIEDMEEFKLLARDKGVDKKLSFGIYDIKYNTSYSDIIKLLIK